MAEVIAFDEHLIRKGMYSYNEMGSPDGVQNLTQFEHDWMLNEQVLCLCDASYFLTRYCFLKNEENVVQRYTFRVPQLIYFDIVCHMESQDLSIEIMALKARQLGVSIFSELLIAHRSIFSYGVSSVLGSADQTKTQEMSKMLLLCYDKLPVWLRPQHTSRVESERGKLLFGQMASGISFQHGSQKFGIATGSTPTIYHLSECALFGDAAVSLIDEGLWKAVHASPQVLGILESTGRGNTGWWADTWYFSKQNWPACRMRPMFLPWYCGVDIYPMPADMRARPVPPGWMPDRDTRAHVARAALYVRSNPLIERYLIEDQKRKGILQGSLWQMPIEQQWYWEWNHKEAKEKDIEGSFFQEMAGDDEEALQRSIDSVFGHETIEIIDSTRKRDYECFTLSGQSIEDKHEVDPQYFDYTKPRIPVTYSSARGVGRWELIPLKPVQLNEKDPADAESILIIWHHPQPRVDYSIGVDTAGGKGGGDSTVISVWALGYNDQPDVQVAEFSSSTVSHVEAFAFILAIAAYYKKHMEVGVTRWKEPYVSIEQVEAVGDVAQNQMGLMGYSNFHKMPRYDGTPKKIARQKKGTGAKTGWYTWGWSRPILTDSFVHWAKNGWAKINSPWMIEEMKIYEIHFTAKGIQKFEHEEGGHDDRIMSGAMAVFCPHDMEQMAHRSKKRIDASDSLPPIDVGTSSGMVVSSSQMRDSTTMTLEDVIYSDQRLDRFRH